MDMLMKAIQMEREIVGHLIQDDPHPQVLAEWQEAQAFTDAQLAGLDAGRGLTLEVALRAIAFGNRERLQRWLRAHHSEAYYPNADTEDLRIHIARRALVI
jgi:hypothetical protein